MDVSVMGYAPDVIVAANSLVEAGHCVPFIGPYPQLDKISNREVDDFCRINPAKKLRSHDTLMKRGVENVLLIHYPSLIAPKHIDAIRHFNIHYALLPKYRGKHGLAWAIINGEKQVGYTLHLVDEGMDRGPIYHQRRIKISDSEDIGDIRNRILDRIHDDLGRCICEIECGKKPRPQNHSRATYVTHIGMKDCLIDWNWSARRSFDFIRALTPPVMKGAHVRHEGRRIVLSKATYLGAVDNPSRAGRVVKIDGNSIWVGCADGPLQIDEIIIRGRSMAPAKLFSKRGMIVGKRA